MLATAQLRDLTRERQQIWLEKERLEKEELRKAQISLDHINRDREKTRQRRMVRPSRVASGIEGHGA